MKALQVLCKTETFCLESHSEKWIARSDLRLWQCDGMYKIQMQQQLHGFVLTNFYRKAIWTAAKRR
ncbi:expressed protein [Arabidopsis lyrata subsp. lyrata]|uniref:Expressed protein n=1 Tax=Arabidopsis lyrata subsp. lyrata TaxID=81972 RepID=D7LCF9_ARALL|nr:expressed protein [Arabidopsis lyrata subsp. lyrata]